MNEKSVLYCESPENSPLLFNLRLQFKAHTEQSIPAVPSRVFVFISIG